MIGTARGTARPWKLFSVNGRAHGRWGVWVAHSSAGSAVPDPRLRALGRAGRRVLSTKRMPLPLPVTTDRYRGIY